jgi:hypothetical protein
MSDWLPWIGVDLDGTLADNRLPNDPRFMIPFPVPAMVERVKEWLSHGATIRIMTARMCENPDLWRHRIAGWTKVYLGVALEATNVKDYGMIELWDDRAITVEENTGRVLTDLAHFKE